MEFARDVLPILSEKCFLCHGPDATDRQAGMRLDLPEGAYADRGGRFPIVPGKPESSLVVQRITSKDSPMPPAYSGKTLSDAQRSVLVNWIKQGAKYTQHWAFVPLPDHVAVPAVSSSWVRDPLDAFVLARLQSEGLSPSAEAPRERWLRRVSYDLTGLQPSPSEVSSFLADGSSSAYETVVDRLLASPRYGERMAVPWLDSARYADSYGYQSDLLASVWPYRDWVISAFNKGMRYDEFLRRQIAGDLVGDSLPTAFNRLHRLTNEGGSIEGEYKTLNAMDRAETFGTAVLGLTVGCARCHDHKYDPLKQKEYYQLTAYFNSIDERGLYNGSEVVPAPTLLMTDLDGSGLPKAREGFMKARAEAQSLVVSASVGCEGWLKAGAPGAEVHGVVARVSLDSETDGKFLSSASGPFAQRYGNLATVDGKNGEAVLFDGDDGLAVRGLPDVDRWDSFTWSFWIRDDERVAEPRVLLHKTGGTDTGFAGFDLMLIGGRLQARIYRDWPGNALAIESVGEVPEKEWANIAWSWNADTSAKGLKLYLNGKLLEMRILRDELWKRVRVFGDLGPSGGAWAFGSRFRCLGFKGGVLDQVAYADRALSPLEVRDLYDGRAIKEAVAHPDMYKSELEEFYASEIDDRAAPAREAVRKGLENLVSLEDRLMEVPVMRETAVPVPAYLLGRGQYDAPKEVVHRGVPAFLPPLPKGAPSDRLGLVEWALRPEHPLTSRVFVNRVWQMMFGTGLVKTSENFGVLGEQPSHPELLDYLARWFVDSGWDIKALVKKIALCATYRQDSALTPMLEERDPENRLLARGPSHRMDAEMVRDTVLFASGLLDDRIGGPPVNPYQPAGTWTDNNAFSPPFVQSKGRDLYRRSIYTTWKRTTPAPDMLAFDAAGREVCVMRRTRTSTPMQALVTLNDAQYVEAARALAERAMKAHADREGQIKEAFLRLVCREPSVFELGVLRQGFDEQLAYYRGHLLDALDLVSDGDSKRDEGLLASEVAAMTVTVQTIMNMDAVVWER